MKKILVFSILVVVASVFFADPAMAQCAMCKAAKANNTAGIGKGLNAGIVYLMSVPYIAAGIIGILWYRNTKKAA